TSYIAAALAEPLACALHGIDAGAIASDATVAILGAGPLGLLLTAVAKLRGACVTLAGRGSERLALGKRFGADCVLDISGLSLQEQCDTIRAQTEGRRGADVVIEAVGKTETWELAVRAVRPGGLVN